MTFQDINFSKQKISETKHVSEDLYSNLYDYFVEREDIDYNNYFGKENIIVLLDKLIQLTYPRHSDVEEIMTLTLHSENFSFHYTEILNWFLYSHSDYFRDSIIKEKIKILASKMNVVRHYPKQFTQMILCTKDGSIIKKFLNNLFNAYRQSPFSKYYEEIAVQYLLARSFKNSDLKDEISNENYNLGKYIADYCKKKSNYFIITDSSNNVILNMMKQDSILNFLNFMSFYYMDKNQILESFAYQKNYFDRKLAYYVTMLDTEKPKKGKVSFNSTWQIARNNLNEFNDVN